MPTPVTLHRNYPNVDPANFLDEDVLRLVDALDMVDLDVHNLITDVAGKAATVHGHAQSDITGLVSDLAGKASASHAHALSDLSDVNTAGAANGHFMRLSGAEWISVEFVASMIISGTIDIARLPAHLAVAALNAAYAAASHTHTFASLTSKPTTVAGYGITDFNSLGDARWQGLSADLTAIVSAGNWKVFYTNGSGVPTELALGDAGTVLQSNGPTSAPSFATPSGGADPGDMKFSARPTAAAGWSLCDGGALSRTTEAALFAAIGTTYGAGDGSTTFNKPNMSGRSAVGAGTATISETLPAANFNTNDIITVGSNNQEAGTVRWQTGMKVQVSTSGVLPTGISAATDYYVRRLNSTTISLYTSRQAAQNIGNNSNPDVTGRVNITATGSGNHTITHTMATRALGEMIGNDLMTAVPSHRHETLGGSSMSGLDSVASNGGSSNRNDGTAFNGETDGVSNWQPSTVGNWFIKL